MTSQTVQNKQQSSNNSSVLGKPLHANAAKLAKEYANVFAETLISHSKTIAYEKGDDEVQSSHVREALDFIRREPKKKRWKELLIFFSSTVLGFAIQSFLAELSKFSENPPTGNTTATIIYGLLNIIAAVIATIAIIR